MANEFDPWEQMKRLTLDQLLTYVKKQGSAVRILGRTEEGWPFAIVVGVGKPGNDRVMACVQEFDARMTAATSWHAPAGNTSRTFVCPECGRTGSGANATVGFCEDCGKWTGFADERS
jgi:predicted RNA-binding Zn-ribbon protein involved in translation (DUF1610 family)